MASIQEIETKVLVLEDKMDFLLKALPITLNVQGKVLRKDGLPGFDVRKTNMLELYRLMKSGTGSTTIIPTELPAEPFKDEEKPNPPDGPIEGGIEGDR